MDFDRENSAAESPVPDVPSYRTIRRLDDEGPAWLVEDAAGIRHTLRPGGDYDGTHPVHDHVLRVDELVHDAAGRPMAVTEYAAGGSLARLFAVRGGFPPGEAVTIVAPIALALASMHAAGRLHGRVVLSGIYLRESGQPAISVPRTRPAALGQAGEEGRREDVRAAALVCWQLIAGHAAGPDGPALGRGPLAPLRYLVPEVPPELNLLIARALEPGTGMGAEELADGLLRSATALPVRLMAGTDRYQDPAGALTEEILIRPRTRRPEPRGTRPRRGIRRRREEGSRRRATPRNGARRRAKGGGRRLPAAVAAAGLLVAALGGVLLLGGQPEGYASPPASPPAARPASPSVSPSAAPETDPAEALAVLSRVREELFRTLDPDLMAGLSVEGSPAREADERMVARLRDEGATLAGFSVEVAGARTVERSDDGAVARVRAEAGSSGYREITASGSAARGAVDPAPLEFELRRVDGRWLVYAVYPA